MVSINFNSEEHSLTVDGHANFAKPGEDVVCAAISILVYTLGACLSEDFLKEPLDISLEVGSSHIKCVPDEQYLGNVDMIFATIMTGFELLARVYPENVKLNIM